MNLNSEADTIFAMPPDLNKARIHSEAQKARIYENI